MQLNAVSPAPAVSSLLKSEVSMEEVIILFVTLFFPPILLTCVLVVALGFCGQSLGIRRLYVNGLLNIFEWATQHIHGPHHPLTSSRSLTTLQEEPEDELSEGETPASYAPKLLSKVESESIIHHDSLTLMRKKSYAKPDANSQVATLVDDALVFLTAGVEAIVEDEVTSRFEAAQLPTWNLLTRTSYQYHNLNWKLRLLHLLSLFVRYCILLPGRLLLLTVSLTLLVAGTTLIGYVPSARLKRWLYWQLTTTCFRITARSVSAIVTPHHAEHMAKPGGICVANHTSPMDVIFLSCDRPFALVGQKQGGLLGVIQRALNRATHHIWFERAEVNDRLAVAKKLREHVEDKTKLPILIFPEGTCINNTSVMQFKKGCFEVGGTIYPAAIKYDSRLGDPFWNSSAQSYGQYLIMMMTSWAIVCDIWYLPPMTRKPGESGIDFASRAKKAIAEAGGLVDLEWDGQLKRYPVKKQMREDLQTRYSRRVVAATKTLPVFSSDTPTNGNGTASRTV